MRKVKRQDGFKREREREDKKVNGKLRRRLKESEDKCYSCGERGENCRLDKL